MRMTKRRAIFSVVAMAALLAGCGRSPEQRDLDARARAARSLASAIPAEHAAGRIIIVANPFIRKEGSPPDVIKYHKAVVGGLEKGLKRSIRGEDIVFPTLRDGAWDHPERFLTGRSWRTPLTPMMEASTFDEIARAHPDARLLISIVGLPEGIERTAIWTNSTLPALALYLPDWRVVPDPKAWGSAIERGRIVAMVIEHAGLEEGLVIRTPRDADEFFQRVVFSGRAN